MKTPRFYGKTTASLLASLFFMTGVQQAQATLLTPAQAPLILTESVAPNLIFTLDDSGSMRWAFTPDDYNGNGSKRQAKSSASNPMYYNPAVTYLLPVKYNADGSRASSQYTTSFTTAYNNGFDTSKGSLNLSTGYQVSWTYDPKSTQTTTSYGYSNTNNRLAANPQLDFGAITPTATTTPGPSTATPFSGSTTSNISNGSNTTTTINGATFRFTRTNTTPFCTAVITTGTSSVAAPGVVQNNTPSPTLTTTTVTTTTTSYSNPTCSRSGSTSTTYNLTGLKTVSTSTTVTVSRADLTAKPVPAYYYLYDTTLSACTSPATTNESCYRVVFVNSTSGEARADDAAAGTDERANFARWFSFYRNRALTTLSAANIAFTGLPRSMRVTWQTLGGCTTFGSTDALCGTNYLRKFTSNHVGNFFNWLPNVTFSASTYLKEAMIRSGSLLAADNSPIWAKDPNPLTSSGGVGTTVQDPKYSCRANYQIMMTDGMWNSEPGSYPSDFKPDETAIAELPDKTPYSKQTPFVDAQDKTLADLAFHYWATDASTLANDIKPLIIAPNSADPTAQYWDPRNDPATWQHLTTYTIGLGLNSSLTAAGIPWTGDTHGGAGYDALVAGTKTWPPATSGNSNNVYDLWHTAINSRGEFFSADSPDTVVDAFTQIISRISLRTTSAGAPGVVSQTAEGEISREVYETELKSEDWSGNLTRFDIDSSNRRTETWSAKSVLRSKAAADRNIRMVHGSNLRDFTWANLSAEQQAMLNKDNDLTNTPTDNKGEDRLNYIRGDQSQEGSADGTFRIRSTVLGDIINSNPTYVGTPKYVPYLADAIEGVSLSQSYATFKAANRAEKLLIEVRSPRRPMVYVGANDGMLHGFDANTGEERFAFVPSAVIENLYKLPAHKYAGSVGHHFYVDGTPVVRDVFYGNAWHTVLVGTLRAGGRSIFALDITDADNITLLWEKTFNNTDLANLGYTFSQPTIARLHTGNWAAVLGNGYGNQASSAADKASLMVFDIETGDLQSEMVVNGDETIANGLSTPMLADNNSDGVADYAYAGDLQGNMWRFDLVTTRTNPVSPDPFKRGAGFLGNIAASSFAVSYGGTPLFKAKDSRSGSDAKAQAITAPPTLVRHPSTLGYLVIFGTGKYFEEEDSEKDNTRAMTLYGIWDRKTKGQTTSSHSPPARSDLQEQTITAEPTNPFKLNVGVDGIRIVSDETVQWYKTNATGTTDLDVEKWGWALDLHVANTDYTGEMMINPMGARGQTLLANTLIPNEDPCKNGVESWQFGLDAYTGGRTKYAVFDLDNSQTIDNNDSYTANGVSTVVSAYKKPGSGGFATNNGSIYTAPGQGGGMKYSAGPGSSGRQSWRVIPERETLE
jgi:type IV pilus assembly protein PilY1